MLHLMAYCNFQSEENESDDAFYVDITTLYMIVGNYKCVTCNGKKVTMILYNKVVYKMI